MVDRVSAIAQRDPGALAPSGQAPIGIANRRQLPIDTEIANLLIRQSQSGNLNDFRTNEQAFAKVLQAFVGVRLKGLEAERVAAEGTEIARSISSIKGMSDETKQVLGVLARDPKNRGAIIQMLNNVQARNAALEREGMKIEAATILQDEKTRSGLALEAFKQKGRERIERIKQRGKAPQSRERKSGNQIIFEQFNPETGLFEEISRAPRASGSELDRLFERAGINPESQTAKDIAKQILERKGKGQFFEVTTQDGTTVRFGTGGDKDSGLQRKTKAQVEADLLSATDNLRRLHSIAATFRPEFQTFGFKARTMLSAFLDKAGVSLSPQQEVDLANSTVFRRRAFEAINLYIKQITGAQMSEREANRLRKAMPDPERDSPIQYKAKLDDVLLHADLAIARMNWIRKRGFEIPAETRQFNGFISKQPDIIGGRQSRMFQIVEERKNEIAKDIRSVRPRGKNQSISEYEREIDSLANRRAAREFGLIGGR